MEASIPTEDEQYIGADVVDNQGVTHELTLVKSTGEIEYHSQDGYADDPDERSPEGKKHVGQASRYAKYHVYRERGYETFDASENPDRLLNTAIVLDTLSPAAFEEHFGDLYQQLKSHYTDQEPAVHVEPEVREDAFMIYAKEIYLGLDDTDLADLTDTVATEEMEAYVHDVGTLLDDSPAGSAGVIDQLDELAAKHGLDDLTDETPAPEQWLAATPTIYPRWRIGTEIHQDPEQMPEIDGKPDCRLEIVPYDPDSIEDLQEYVIQHIKCQIRDTFVRMGVTPPEPFQVQGPGLDLVTMMYQHYESLQPYHDPEATIDWGAV
jgi:hypothetical protein